MKHILSQVQSFYKNVGGFFSGILCSLCNPLAKNFFEFTNGDFYIRVSPRVCRGVYQWYRFSFQLIDVFNKWVFPLVEFTKCVTNKMEDPNFALYIILDDFVTKRNDVKICYEDMSFYDNKCKKLCSVDLQNFTIKFSFIQNFKQALKSNVLFFETVALF